jgi:hypothetical protein
MSFHYRLCPKSRTGDYNIYKMGKLYNKAAHKEEQQSFSILG